jgi:hypothetical protein
MTLFTQLNPKQKIIVVIQSVMILFPSFVIIMIFFYNPTYFLKLLQAGDHQPIGWLIAGVNLFLLAVLLGLFWKIMKNMMEKKMLLNYLLLFLFIIIDYLVFIFIILSPTILILLTSPIGKMFFVNL